MPRKRPQGEPDAQPASLGPLAVPGQPEPRLRLPTLIGLEPDLLRQAVALVPYVHAHEDTGERKSRTAVLRLAIKLGLAQLEARQTRQQARQSLTDTDPTNPRSHPR